MDRTLATQAKGPWFDPQGLLTLIDLNSLSFGDINYTNHCTLGRREMKMDLNLKMRMYLNQKILVS